MDPSNRSQQEKRNFIRMRVDTPAEVIIERNGQRLKGICRDLSGGGMLIETPQALEIGWELVVQLASSYANTPMLRARTQVARVQGNRAGNYILGLEIMEMLD